MTIHRHREYACAAGAGGKPPEPMGKTFEGTVENGLILNVDTNYSLTSGRANGYRIFVQTETGKKISISTGTSVGEMMGQGERYSFKYKVSKQGKGYCFKGKPTLLSPTKDPSSCQRSHSTQANASYRPCR